MLGTPIRPVLLFDLFGVIARTQSEPDKRLLQGLGRAEPDTFWPAYWQRRRPYDLGQPARDYWTAVGNAVGTRYSRDEIQVLVEADIASWSRIDKAMVDYLQSLDAAGYQLGLLSNIPADLAERFEAEQPWLSLFAVRRFSCQTRQAKPDPAAYLGCAARLGCPLEQILFIDDREENVQAARQLGLGGHTFENLATLQACLEREPR
ncbi:HAD-IA family hydrolase [Pseudomonas mangiferae]|uniref:HAD-IA family hydrolase n=1 Tax=Pseudomonas mangiferae TaxID=2593654 RepID=A0A553GTC5_9PSED|nr:HAD-IA family hydrolase [Pseudomonas mangiferae]TRX72736.1 HAD-IA family hydrolase [Pseudomonas mangiferae]